MKIHLTQFCTYIQCVVFVCVSVQWEWNQCMTGDFCADSERLLTNQAVRNSNRNTGDEKRHKKCNTKIQKSDKKEQDNSKPKDKAHNVGLMWTSI